MTCDAARISDDGVFGCVQDGVIGEGGHKRRFIFGLQGRKICCDEPRLLFLLARQCLIDSFSDMGEQCFEFERHGFDEGIVIRKRADFVRLRGERDDWNGREAFAQGGERLRRYEATGDTEGADVEEGEGVELVAQGEQRAFRRGVSHWLVVFFSERFAEDGAHVIIGGDDEDGEWLRGGVYHVGYLFIKR